VVAGSFTLVVGLTLTFILERDFYLLAGVLSFGVRRASQIQLSMRGNEC
jgi:hypothetical protein